MIRRRARRQIGDYGFLSDCHTAALVDGGGSIDWWCPGRFDSPSAFARLLDDDAGHWSLHPEADHTSTRRYVGPTLVLRTTFRTHAGQVEVTDGLALEPGARGHDIGGRSPHTLLRRVQGVVGSVSMAMEFAPRMEYGLTSPHLSEEPEGLVARGGPLTLTCAPTWTGPAKGPPPGRPSRWPGETLALRLEATPSFPGTEPSPWGEGPTIEDTVDGWESWSETAPGVPGSPPRRRSAKLPGAAGAHVPAQRRGGSGGHHLAAQMIGGDLNFDYRFAWLRDLSLTMRSLWIAACPDEAGALFQWIAQAAGQLQDERVQVMYGVAGERDLTEHSLDHLAGFQESKPVRIGNDAWDQSQLDALGEVLDAAHQLGDRLGELSEGTQSLLVALAERATDTWRDPDAGMWEARDQLRQYVSSK